MINRRLLRIKVIQVLYAFYKSDKQSIDSAQKELIFSLDKSEELYHLFLLMVLELVKRADEKIEANKRKRLPSQEDMNPNRNFVDNKFVLMLQENEAFLEYSNKKKLSWADNQELIKTVYKVVLDSPDYREFMALENPTFEEDKRFWVRMFKKVIPEIAEIGTTLEEMSIFWNDDAELILSMLQKTIKRFEEENGPQQQLMPILSEDEDRQFAIKLLKSAITNGDKYTTEIKKHLTNWDPDRLAFMDILTMQVAIAELIAFPGIPPKVTLNEFIEIAKNYSTAKSSTFINGVLDNVIKELKTSGQLVKTGRGLMEK